MKKIFAIFIALAMMTASLVSCSDNQENSEIDAENSNSASILNNEESNAEDTLYERVVLIGVDGGGNFFRDTDTPNIDKIFENGAVTYEAITATPSISAQCWGSMLLGVTADVHRLSNSLVESNPYDTESKFPSIFRVISENDPDAVLASFCNWNPINVGIIEDNLGVYKDTGNDAEITQKICDYVAENDPTMLFVQFDEADGAGHSTGYGGAVHLAQITTIDGYIGRIYEAYEARGFLDETLFIVTADHGGLGTSHGGDSEVEMQVMYAVCGKTVESGTIGEMEIRDNASIILHALGYDQPDTWTSRVPDGVFEGIDADERPVYEITYDYVHRTHENQPTPTSDSGKYITDIFGDRVMTYLPLDGDIADAMGNVTTVQEGKLYYVEGYYGNGVQFDDGYISIADYAPGNDSFTIGVWMKTNSVSSDPALFSNKDWNSGSNPGYILSLRSGDVKFNLGNGSTRMDIEYILPLDYANGWVHLLLSVDREAGTVSFAYDFGDFTTVEIPEALKDASFDGFDVLNIGQDGTGTYSAALSAVLDDFVILEGTASADDAAALAEYYGVE